MAASLDSCSNVRNRNINHVTHGHQQQHPHHHRRPIVTRDSPYDYNNVSPQGKSSSTHCKMKNTLSTSKTIVVISIVIGCFAILWPRMFYPMLQAAFRSQSTTKKVPYMDRTGVRGSMHPAMMHPRIREAMASGNKINSVVSDASTVSGGGGGSKVPVVPLRARDRNVSPGQIKGSSNLDLNKLPSLSGPGVMGLVMPIYSIVIVAFFLYTMFKLISKNETSTEDEDDVNDAPRPHLTDDTTVDHCSNNHHGNYYNDICFNSIKRSPDHAIIPPSSPSSSPSSSSSPFTKHVQNATKEISKLASQYSNLKDVDDFVAGSSFAFIKTDHFPNQSSPASAGHLHPHPASSQSCHFSSSSSSRAQNKMLMTDDRYEYNDENHPHPHHHHQQQQVHSYNHRSPCCPSVNNSEQRHLDDSDSVTCHQEGNNSHKSQLNVHSQHSLRHLARPNECHEDDDKCYGKQIKDVKKKLEEKEQIMVKLLCTIEGVGSKLVEAGILPAIPGLFSSCISSSSSSILASASAGGAVTKSGDGKESDFSSLRQNKTLPHKRTTSSIDEDLPSDTKLLEKQLAASTCFIASLGSGAKTLFSPSYRSSVVSEALRLLIQNMELFKSYLIEVENLRQRLNLLEMRRLSINYTDTNDESSSLRSSSKSDSSEAAKYGHQQQQETLREQKEQKQEDSKDKKGNETTTATTRHSLYPGDDDDDDDGDDDYLLDGTTCGGTLDVEEVDSESQLTCGDFCKRSSDVEAADSLELQQKGAKSQSEDSNYGREEIYVGDDVFQCVDIAGGKVTRRNLTTTTTTATTTTTTTNTVTTRRRKNGSPNSVVTSVTQGTTCRGKNEQDQSMEASGAIISLGNSNMDSGCQVDEGCNELNSIFNAKLKSNSSCNECSSLSHGSECERCCTCCCCITCVTSKRDTHLMVNEEANTSASKFDLHLSKLNDEPECEIETGQGVEKNECEEVKEEKEEEQDDQEEERTTRSETKSDHRQESPKKPQKQLATVATGEEDGDDEDEEDEEEKREDPEVNDASKVPQEIQVKSSSGIETQTGISTLVNSEEHFNDKTQMQGKKIPIAGPHQSQSSKLHQIEVKANELRRRNRKKRKSKTNCSRL